MAAKPMETMNKLEKTSAGWKSNAPDAKFYRLTQAEYDAKVELSRDVRRRLAAANRLVDALENERNDIDKANLATEGLVAKAIGGDPDYGEDSTLWESTGRKRKSEYKRAGRKTTKPAGTT